LGLESASKFPIRAALFTQVYDNVPSGAFDRQKIRVTIHPTLPDVWYWLIPFSNGRSSIGVVAADEILQRYVGTKEERLWSLHREDPGLAGLLRDARPAIEAGELRGYAANVSRMFGPGFALLGNAAEFLDPVFSSGVTIAMKSATLAAAALTRELNGETVDWKIEFEEPLRLGVDTFRNFVEAWYEGSLQDIFFHQRQEPTVRRHICSILAGYAWDPKNPYVGKQGRHRLNALARLCGPRPGRTISAAQPA
ncbi:MAG: NAD(P)/FAD-dependent oxidoreductase, partial [Panacagrimonas sp.]